MDLKTFPDDVLINVCCFLLEGTLYLNKYFYSIVKNHGSACFTIKYPEVDDVVELVSCKINYMNRLYKKMDVVSIHNFKKHTRYYSSPPIKMPYIDVSRLKLYSSQIHNFDTFYTLKHLEIHENNGRQEIIANIPNLETLLLSERSIVSCIQYLPKLKTLIIKDINVVYDPVTIINLPSLINLHIGSLPCDLDEHYKNKCVVKNQITIININVHVQRLFIGTGVDPHIRNEIHLVDIEGIFESRPTKLKTFSITGNTSNSFLQEELKSRKHKVKRIMANVIQRENN